MHIGSVNRGKRQLELSQGVSDGVGFPKHYTLKEEASRNAVPTLLFASHPQGVSTIDSRFTARGQGCKRACMLRGERASEWLSSPTHSASLQVLRDSYLKSLPM